VRPQVHFTVGAGDKGVVAGSTTCGIEGGTTIMELVVQLGAVEGQVIAVEYVHRVYFVVLQGLPVKKLIASSLHQFHPVYVPLLQQHTRTPGVISPNCSTIGSADPDSGLSKPFPTLPNRLLLAYMKGGRPNRLVA
jgi:hypothetical protein